MLLKGDSSDSAIGMSKANSYWPVKYCRHNFSHPAVSSVSRSPPKESSLINPLALPHWKHQAENEMGLFSENHRTHPHCPKHLQSITSHHKWTYPSLQHLRWQGICTTTKNQQETQTLRNLPFSPEPIIIHPKADLFLFPTTAHRGFLTIKTTPSWHLLSL